ncbi:MAG: hypothetical protein LUI02_02420, partial [Clostridiales bacterium]|nr:hypothetical protein [Clostridiales bacterium]
EEDGKKQIKLLLIAIPDNLLTNYCQLAEQIGLRVDTFDYIGNGTVQYMRGLLDDNSVVVQLEEQATVISIIKDKKLAFQRVTPYGYSSALASVVDNTVLGVRDEYEAFDFLLKNDVIYSRPYAHDAGDSEDVASRQALLDEAYDELKESMNYHLRVVNTALEYYQNQVKEDFQGSLFMVGDGSRFAGLSKLFESELPLYSRKVDFGALIDIKVEKGAYVEENRDPAMMAGLLTVIGAASNPIQVNAREIATSSSDKNIMRTAYTVLVGAVVISILLVAIACFRQLSAASEQKKLQEEISKLTYVQDIYDENTLASSNLEMVTTIQDATTTNNEQLLSLIESLEECFPSDMSVESLQASDTTVTMNMKSSERISIGQLLLNLQDVPELAAASVPSIAESTDELGNTIWTYTVTATYADYPPEEETEEAEAETEEVEEDE